jgi:tape measure domain-containing protein
MQIAKMFASLGFNVDMTGLEKFRNQIKLARTDISNLGRDAASASRSLSGMAKALDGLSGRLDKTSIAKSNNSLKASYENVAMSVGKVDKAFQSISANQKNTTKSLGRIHASVKSGSPIWDRYRASVLATRDALKLTNDSVLQLRKNASVTIKTRGSTRSGGDGGYRSNRPMDLSGGGFFRSMLPAVAIAGGLPTLGFAAKEVVQQGREQTKMESTLLATSKNTEEFGDTLSFVREEALRLGLSSVELGKSFAQVNMSAEKLSQTQKKEMFTGMSEFMMSMGTSRDDQKGIFRAINQMFSNTRILQEEINQLSERGIPATLVWNAAKKAYGIEDITQIKKLQESGQLDPSKVLPEMARMLQEMARTSGAYDKMMESSIVKQGQFMERLSQLSKKFMDSGVDVMLGKIFQQLSNIVDTLDEIGSGLSAMKKALDDATGGNSGLSIALTILAALLFRNRKAVTSLAKSLWSFSGIARVVTGFLNGRAGQALINFTKRWGLLGAAITSVIYLAKKVGEALKLRESGEWTWLDTMLTKWQILKLRMDNASMALRIFWSNFRAGLKVGMNPLASFGEFDRIAVVGQASQLAKGNIPAKSAAQTQKEQERLVKRQQEAQNFTKMISEAEKPSIPYRGAGMGDWKVPKVVNDISVMINGVSVPDNQVSIMGNVR